MIDTARILVDWLCNLKCPYCCNEQDRFRKDIKPIDINAIDFNKYTNFCVSGGEPLLHIEKVKDVCGRIPKGKLVILYTNGLLLNAANAALMQSLGFSGINVGLHYPKTFDRLIAQCTEAAKDTALKVRFHLQDIYEKEFTAKYPDVSFRFWKMDDCDRDNEERFVLTN